MADSDTLTSNVSDDFLKNIEENYNDEKSRKGRASDDTTFQYAWCLVRSRLKTDIKRGILLLEELLKKDDTDVKKRDYLYYIAVGHARNKDYTLSLKFLKALLQIEPGNKQAQALEKEIRSAMDSDALKGGLIAGGGLLAAGALVGLYAILKNK